MWIESCLLFFNMPKKLTTQEFIERARKVHGDKYDYSKAEYVNISTKVCIVCPTHGDFWQRPSDHIFHGSGCPLCNFSQKDNLIYGFGVNDIEHATLIYPQTYGLWRNMLRRCYDEKTISKHPTYKGCYACEEWKYFSKFKEWFDEHYVDGWHLDKDILIKGNKEYSPETCCFVPQEINKLFTKRQLDRGQYPIGIVNTVGKKYLAAISLANTIKNIGLFDTIEDAFEAYKEAKETWIKELADKWKGQLELRVYEAMYNYKVEITD